jgi:hypothetical protein
LPAHKEQQIPPFRFASVGMTAWGDASLRPEPRIRLYPRGYWLLVMVGVSLALR